MDLAGTRIIDAHIHQWDPFATPRIFSGTAKLFRLLPVPVGAAAWLAPRCDREFSGDPGVFLSPYLPADYRSDAGDLPVDGIVHIEVGWAGKGPNDKAGETRWVASLPFGVDTPRLAAIIGGGDPAAAGFPDLLDAHRSASPLVRGIRTMAAHHPDPGVRSFAKAENHLGSPAFLDGFAQLAEHELSFEAWVYSHQLPAVAELAKRYPQVPIVLNHLGTPAGIFGAVGKHTGTNPSLRRELFVRWRDDLAALATHPSVVAKVSGLTMPILGHPVPPRGAPTPVPVLLDRIGPMLEHAMDVFGADRLLWGSNYPVDRPITSIANSVEAVAAAVTGHGGGPAELARIFRDNARRVYRIDDENA
ncbi:amidohydrolase family protein [Nocardia altamirensis]|uniref:amidohydrolase family protein n=1 Tax=Nocardia altamirensis TaxID=472158 RepID=UPI00084014DB|nr:amidohydrolase family protein [Nocardia altamirensis]